MSTKNQGTAPNTSSAPEEPDQDESGKTAGAQDPTGPGVSRKPEDRPSQGADTASNYNHPHGESGR
jgi:hypothetical protein